jgi:serine protease
LFLGRGSERAGTLHARLSLALAGALIIGASLLAGPAAAAQPTVRVPESTNSTDRVIIRWADAGMAAARAPSSIGRLNAMTTALGSGWRASYLRPLGTGAEVYSVGGRLGTNEPRILAALRRLPGVAWVEPDGWRTASALPNDRYASELWGLAGANEGEPYGIDALTAWQWTKGKTAIVAVVDTGIVDHPDLKGQTVPGYDMISDRAAARDGDGRDSDPSDEGDWGCGGDSSWHGTHVAGTIAALANNKIGVFGGAPAAKILPVRVLGRCGGSDSDVIAGVIWAAGGHVAGVPDNPRPAKVVNLSLGGDEPSGCPASWSEAIAYAHDLGALVVVAAGNENQNAGLVTPANCTQAMTVAATDWYGKRAACSFGDCFSNYGDVVDVAAPGLGIKSTVNTGTTVPASPTYDDYSGTSMAAPHVSLSAALLFAAQPGATPDIVEEQLELTATPFPSKSGCNNRCGSGIVNVGRAFSLGIGLLQPTPPLDVKAVPGEGSATIFWSAPASTGGSPIKSYTARSSPDGLTCTSADALTCTVTGLINGTSYRFVVYARNKMGRSSASAKSKPVTPAGDETPPVVSAPKVAILAGRNFGTTATTRISWPPATDASGIGGYQLRLKQDAGDWSNIPLASPTDLSADVQLAPASTYHLRLRAKDAYGNTSVATATGTLLAYQQSAGTIVYSSGWKTAEMPGASGGAVGYATKAGSKATFTFKGTSVGFISTMGASRGIAELWLDGKKKKKKKIDLYSATGQRARVVWSIAGLSASKSHTLEVRVTGSHSASSKGNRVDLDAFLVWR